MRSFVISGAIGLAFVGAMALPAAAQDAAPPLFDFQVDPETSPDTSPPPEDPPPMVIPPPDEEATEAPEAFGSAPIAESEPADEPDGRAADETPAEERERLFAELRKEPSDSKARRIASRIERLWRNSGSATVDLLMLRAAEAMAKEKNAAAFDVLDQALVLDPGYAEAWNRRATLNFTAGAWGKSLADIEQTLTREPRHWGALMGLAMILERTGRKDKALETYLRVLAVYPALKSAQDAAGRLSEELVGPAI
ncbi:tetratricopeptide repeat protein [Aurantimonas marina]|uniref:tetratricopeptide repeat protein n=1 Tax=Aurantimonas marina TaxID=2780508 RepID=UPI0019D28FA5|nr:tetratricopeptide repeat protein [Aurantimonas marina]